jgi:peptide/histidine transporter 3/4
MGLIANLTVYLQTRYNMDGIQLVNVYNIWSGSTNVTPLLGAFLSDAYLGRFRTLLFGSMSSFLVKSSV